MIKETENPLRIALIGNVCNNMYNMGLALKKYTTIQPHLYLDYHLDIHTTPILNDPDAINQTDWVFQDAKWDPTLYYKKFDKRFIHKLTNEKYDAIIVSSAGVWLAPHVKNTKFLHWTTGGDITKVPFPGAFSFTYKGVLAKAKAFFMGRIHRKGMRYIDKFLSHPFSPNYLALSRLKVPDSKIADFYFPIIIDTEIFKLDENYESKISKENWNNLKKFSFRIFHPSRLMIQQKKALVEAGQWKGNEMLLKGLRTFIDKYSINDICIMLPNRVQSVDKMMFDEETERLQLHNNIVWLNGKTNQGFDKQEMVALYSSSDLVVDEFGVGWFGSIVVEGTACSKPTMCYIDEIGMKKMYPWHPVISTNTPEGIAEEIAKLYFDKTYTRQKGKESRSWAVQFHSHENAGKVYAEQIQKLLTDI